MNSSLDAPNVFSGTAWARVTNMEGVKPQDWPVKNAELAKTGARGLYFTACEGVREGYGEAIYVTVRALHVVIFRRCFD